MIALKNQKVVNAYEIPRYWIQFKWGNNTINFVWFVQCNWILEVIAKISETGMKAYLVYAIWTLFSRNWIYDVDK